MTAVEQESSVPLFAHAVRGYDRYQVDDYIHRLNEWATGAQARAVEAERQAAVQAELVASLQETVAALERSRPEPPDEELRQTSERTSEIIAAAVREADEIRRRAGEDAERRLDDASRQAVEVVESARRAVAVLNEEASDERRRAHLRIDDLMRAAEQDAADLRAEAARQAEAAIAAGRAEAARRMAEADEEVRRAQDAVERIRAERAEIVAELGRLRGAIHTLIAVDPDRSPAGELEAGGPDTDAGASASPGPAADVNLFADPVVDDVDLGRRADPTDLPPTVVLDTTAVAMEPGTEPDGG